MKNNLGCFAMLFIIGLWVGMFILSGLMFEYSLYTIVGKDVPFILDMLGGVVLNGVNLLIFVFCVIFRACGYSIPIVE